MHGNCLLSVALALCAVMKLGRFQFIGPATRQTFDLKGFEDFLGKSAFASDQIDIQVIGCHSAFAA